MDSMHNRRNILLVKDDVGKAKPCTVRLPPAGFVYGKPDYKQEAGAGVCTGQWKQHESSGYPQKQEIDFKKMNKTTAFNRGLSTREFKNKDEFKLKRRQVGYIGGLMMKNQTIQQKPMTTAGGSRTEAGAVHGKANRPSTPIQGVISFTYANMAEMELKDQYNHLSKAAKESRRSKPIPGNTRARELAVQHVQTQRYNALNPKEDFKLKRFTNVEARTSTYNTKQ